MANGGQPSHPISLGFAVIDNPEEFEEYKDILWFWHFDGTTFHSEFQHQLIEWKKFRDFQNKTRTFYVPRNRFQEYQNLVQENQADRGCPWDIKLRQAQHQQNRLEDWNEFRAFYYRRLKGYKKLVGPAEQNLSHWEKELENAETRLTDVVDDPKILSNRLEDIIASEKEIAKASLRVESAHKSLQAAKRSKSKRRRAALKRAEGELCLAKDGLKSVSGSEEMRKLRDGYDLQIARGDVVRAKARLDAVQLQVKRWEVFLKWIDNQYPSLGAECGYPTKDSVNRACFGSGRDRRSLKRGKRGQPKSVLSPNSSPRISKPSTGKSDPRPRSRLSSSIVPPLTTNPQDLVEGHKPPRRSERLKYPTARKPQAPEMRILSPAHSSRVTKATSHLTTRHTDSGRRPVERSWSTTKRSRSRLGAPRSNNPRRSQRTMAQQLNIKTMTREPGVGLP